MQYGIYYAYWETEWGGNFVPYVEKCARLGFDVLEVACGAFDRENDAFFHELAAAARANGMALTGGYGPRKEHDLATADNAQAEQTFRFYADMFRKMELAGIDRLGGALYSYWPAHGTPQTDKAADTARSVRRMQRLADLASDHGITLGMEALNRFEGYLINTAQECIDYVRAVDRPNVKVMLDTFHMNIEEDSMVEAILLAGNKLGHFHVGENNRRVPGKGGFPWYEIGMALRAIGYQKNVVMEPFVMSGGGVGSDIKVWRDLSNGATTEQLDADARRSVEYLRYVFEGPNSDYRSVLRK